jgi:hypothetical protein
MVTPYYIWQMLWQIGYPVPILVILEHGDVIFAYITEDHKLNDSLHTTLLAQWQLAPPLRNRGNMKKYLFLRCLIPVRDKTSELMPTHKYCRLCDSVALCRCLISFPLMVMSSHISCLWAKDKPWRVNSVGKLQFVLGTQLLHSAVNKTLHIFLICFPSLNQYNCPSYISTQISHIFSPFSKI